MRDPYSQHVLNPGKVYKVRNAQFWLRRLDAGDVVSCNEPKEIVEKEKSPKKKEKTGE